MKPFGMTILFSLLFIGSLEAEEKSLKDVLKDALKNSPYLKLQEKNIDAKSADVQMAWSPFFPNTQGEIGRGRQSKDNYFSKLQKKRFEDTGSAPIKSIETDLPQDIAFWNITVKQDIFKGFENYHNLKEKKKLLDIAKLDLAAERNNLIYDVIETYLYILNLQDDLNFLAKAKLSSQEQIKNLTKRYKVQNVSKSKVEEAEEKYLELDWKELEAKQGLELSRYKLNQLIGKGLHEENIPVPFHSKNITPKALSIYLKNIPKNLDLIKIESEEEKDKYKKRTTYGKHLLMPNLGFEFNYEHRGERYTNLEEGWKLGFFLRAPLFDGLYNFGEQNKAHAGMESSQIKTSLTKQTVEIQIKKHYHSFHALEKSIAHLKKKRDREQRIFDETRKSLKESAATVAQLRAAETHVLETETKLIQNKRRQFLDIAILQKLTGEINLDELF